MGGHGHDPPYKVPDYTEFKIQGIKQLEELENALAAKGLKDPWIRNEAWRYHPGFGTPLRRGLTFFFRGLPLGAVLAGIAVVAGKALGGDDHGHHDDKAHH